MSRPLRLGSAPRPAGKPSDTAVTGQASTFPGTLIVVLVLAAAMGGLVWFITRPAPSPEPLPDVPQLSVEGPRGTVVLRDYLDGRRWLTWWRAHRSWAGAPLWAERPYREHPSCAAFEATIVCWNPDAKVKGSTWELHPLLLGTQALRRAGLEPYPSAPPAEIISAYIASLAVESEDVWYRFGAVQSAPILMGDTIVQYYQLARFEWPADAKPHETNKVRQTALGRLAVEQGW